MDFIQRGQTGYQEYRVELDGKFLRWDDVWSASESGEFVNLITHPPEYDILGNIITWPKLKKQYGKIFIVRCV